PFYSSILLLFSFMTPPPPISTLFPYTTLFRSLARQFVALDLFFTDREQAHARPLAAESGAIVDLAHHRELHQVFRPGIDVEEEIDRKSTRLNSSHVEISYAVFCLKKKKKK